MTLFNRAREWYVEKFDIKYDVELNVTTQYECSTTGAKVTRSLVAFWFRNWRWFIGTALTIIGLYIAFLALTKDSLVKKEPSEPSRNYRQYNTRI
jgi:hypothetical protein